MPKYIVSYKGAVEIEASNQNQAEDEAWSEHGVRSEDIEKIEEEEICHYCGKKVYCEAGNSEMLADTKGNPACEGCGE